MSSPYQWIQERLETLTKFDHILTLDEFVEETWDESFDCLDLSEYTILVTGKVDGAEGKKGWVLQVRGGASECVFGEAVVVRVIGHLDDDFPAVAPPCVDFKTLTLSNFRKTALPVADAMSFETTSYLILDEQQMLVRLSKVVTFMRLPVFSKRRLDQVPFFVPPGVKSLKRRSHKKTYKIRSRASPVVENTLDRIIVTYCKSIGDARETLRKVKMDINAILDKRMECFERFVKMEEHREERREAEEEAKIQSEDYSYLLADGEQTPPKLPQIESECSDSQLLSILNNELYGLVEESQSQSFGPLF